jgi:hypothetical protein
VSEVAAAPGFSPKHAGLQRPGAKRQVVQQHLGIPPWHGWKWTAEHKRIIRWIESELVQPVGAGQGQPFRVADFQRQALKRMCDSLASFFSIPVGNGKTTLMAAVGLERVTRGDHYVEVDVLATREDQARRLVDVMIQLIECSPELVPRFEFYKQQAVLEYRPTGSRVTAYPATLNAIQGLNPDLALIDEIAMVPADLVTSMISRLVKNKGGRVVGFGTPGFDTDNMLEALRTMAHSGELPPSVEFIEYAADAGCDVMDQEQHRKANPAIGAGFVDAEALAATVAIMVANGYEAQARAYHLGQPVESSGPWLPYGAWDSCVRADPPRDGTPVCLAVWGNYQRKVSIVGATLDGALFFGWQADKPSDSEVAEAIRAAADQWEVLELCHKPHIRLGLMATLSEEGLPVMSWPSDNATDVESTAAFYQAIAESEVAHDHDPTLDEQVSRLTAKIDRNGNPRLVESEQDVAAGLAARAAWWRAKALAESSTTEELIIY